MSEHIAVWLMTPEAPDLETFIAELVNRPAWHRQAACRGMRTEIFFPGFGSTKRAKAVCEGCPVRTECLDAALADPMTQGVWGGLSAKRRMVLRRSAA